MLISSFNYTWNKLYNKPANKDPYQIGRMRLWLLELQEQEVKKVKIGSRSPYQFSGMRLQLQRLQVKDQWARKVQSKQGLKNGWEVNACFGTRSKNHVLLQHTLRGQKVKCTSNLPLPFSLALEGFLQQFWSYSPNYNYTLGGACVLEKR